MTHHPAQKNSAVRSEIYWQRMSSPIYYWKAYARVVTKGAFWHLTLGLSRSIKRFLDLVIATVCLILCIPVFLVIFILIKLDDGGPIFCSLMRVGYKGVLFRMYKFRSMVPNAQDLKRDLIDSNEVSGGVIFKMKNDPRISRIGKILRKYSIDEIPQFINVLLGEMSLVGPRPCLPEEAGKYRPEDLRRFLAKPGLTCFWQIQGRSTLTFDQQIQLDIKYIRSTSMWEDFKILLRTIPVVILGKGSY